MITATTTALAPDIPKSTITETDIDLFAFVVSLTAYAMSGSRYVRPPGQESTAAGRSTGPGPSSPEIMLPNRTKRDCRLETPAVAVLNSTPNWFVIFAATVIVAASTKTKSAFRRLTKRNMRGEVIKMSMKLTTRLRWAFACVVGSLILALPAELG